jgi:hypothetical protein
VSQRELDDAVEQILQEPVDEKLVREAAGRVFRQLFDATFIAGDGVQKIKGCADVQALIPSYRSGTLSKARAMLVEDHLLGCAECRRAARPQRETIPFPMKKPRGTPPLLAWGLAAALVVGVGIGVEAGRRGILPWQHTLQATVASVQGRLYRVSEAGATVLQVGSIIRAADEVRTAKGSRAILRMEGGASLELSERSDVMVDAAWHGPDVNLERGRMIVQASDSPHQVFYVLSGDLVIPVHAAVLALNHGTKGSRLAVAQGSAQVEQGQLQKTVLAGQQFATTNALYRVPIASEFAWSQNADQYAALLGELTALQKSFEAIPSPGLRYSPELAQYLPASTVVYSAIPNLGPTIQQAKQMFDARLANSAILREWWQQQPLSKNDEFDHLLDQVGSISSYLGNEIVVGLTADKVPVVLAKITQPGLAGYITSTLPADAGVQIVNAASVGNSKTGLYVNLDQGLLIASPSLALARTAGSGQFMTTPLFARVKDVYNSGAGYLVAADLEQIFNKSVSNAQIPVPAGLDNARFLVLEKKDILGTSEMRAALAFDGTRQGMASWLAAPGPVGSLDFVSPDASVAMAVVMKNPRAMMQDLISFGAGADSGFAQHFADFENEAGVSLLDDVAAPLGSDLTFAIDGPGLPTSSWKVVLEVNDQQHLQETLGKIIDRFNQQAPANIGALVLSSHDAGGFTVHTISSSKSPALSVSYLFVDGYLLAGGNEANLLAAIQNKRAGRTLAASAAFRAKLPADKYTNFSAMFYQDMGKTLGPLAEQVKSSVKLTEQQRRALSVVEASGGAGLICVYGEPDQITAASTGSFLGFNLGTLAGLYQGKAVAPLIAANMTLFPGKAVNRN